MKYFPPDIDSCLNKESLKKTLWGYPEQNEILTHEKCGIVINSGEQSEKKCNQKYRRSSTKTAYAPGEAPRRFPGK